MLFVARIEGSDVHGAPVRSDVRCDGTAGSLRRRHGPRGRHRARFSRTLEPLAVPPDGMPTRQLAHTSGESRQWSRRSSRDHFLRVSPWDGRALSLHTCTHRALAAASSTVDTEGGERRRCDGQVGGAEDSAGPACKPRFSAAHEGVPPAKRPCIDEDTSFIVETGRALSGAVDGAHYAALAAGASLIGYRATRGITDAKLLSVAPAFSAAHVREVLAAMVRHELVEASVAARAARRRRLRGGLRIKVEYPTSAGDVTLNRAPLQVYACGETSPDS